MKPELWLNRADHELKMAQELLGAGSLLWAVSYAHRSVEYALEGLIILKTDVRPEKGLHLADLQSAARGFLSEEVHQAISDLVKISPLVWQSELKSEQIVSITDRHAQTLVDEAKMVLSWVGEEWERTQEPSAG